MRRPLQRARILRRSDDRPPLTLPAALRRILRKYPSMLHIAGPAVPILGPELVSNGAFDTADGWSAATGWGISGGTLNHTAPSTLMPALTVATQAGKTYLCAFSISSQSAAGSGVSLRLGSTNLTIRNAVGTYSETLTQTVESNIVGFIARGASGDWLGSIDNLSVREIVGYQNTYASFAAGNYKESTGQTLAAVDQQVGLVVDAGQQPVQELVLNGGFDSGDVWQAMPAAGSAVVSGGVLTVTRTTEFIASAQPINFVAGKVYDINFSAKLVSGSAALTIALRIGGNITGAVRLQHSVAGSSLMTGYSIKYFCANTETLWLQAGAGNAPGVVEFDSVSVRELPGTHAAQATSGYQPYLRKVPKTLGPNLVSNGDFANGLAGWSLYGSATGQVVNGEAEIVAAATNSRLERNIPGVVAGKEYWASASIRGSGQATSLTVIRGASGNYGTIATSGSAAASRKAEFGFYASGSDAIVQFLPSSGTGVGTGYVDDVAVCEVLEWTYAWQFDGVDDRLPLSTLPLASTDDFYQAFALRCSTSGANKTFADLLTNPSTGTRLGCLRINGSNALQVVHANDAGGVVTTAGRTVTDGQQLVVEALRVGASHTVFADGAVDIQTAVAGNYTTTNATIGARGAGTSEPFLGYIYADLVLKGAPSDAERATVRKFLAQLQGRSL